MKGLQSVTEDSLGIIAKALREKDIQYLVVGGIAVIAYGYVRATLDLDLVLSFENDNFMRGLRTLEGIGYRPHIPVTWEEFADPAVREDWSKNRNMVVLQLVNDLRKDTPIDIFVKSPFPFNAAYQKSSLHLLGNGESIRIVSRQDLIEMKKNSGRTKDLNDLEYLNKINEL